MNNQPLVQLAFVTANVCIYPYFPSKLFPPSSPSFPSLPFPFLLVCPLQEWCTFSFLCEIIPFSTIYSETLCDFSLSQDGHRRDHEKQQTLFKDTELSFQLFSFTWPTVLRTTFATVWVWTEPSYYELYIEETVPIGWLHQKPHWSSLIRNRDTSLGNSWLIIVAVLLSDTPIQFISDIARFLNHFQIHSTSFETLIASLWALPAKQTIDVKIAPLFLMFFFAIITNSNFAACLCLFYLCQILPIKRRAGWLARLLLKGMSCMWQICSKYPWHIMQYVSRLVWSKFIIQYVSRLVWSKFRCSQSSGNCILNGVRWHDAWHLFPWNGNPNAPQVQQLSQKG